MDASHDDEGAAITGRPTKLDEDRTRKVVQAILAGCPLAVAARAAGIGNTTLKRWIKCGSRQGPRFAPHRDFRRRVKAALGQWEVDALQRIAAAGAHDWRSQAWLLE